MWIRECRSVWLWKSKRPPPASRSISCHDRSAPSPCSRSSTALAAARPAATSSQSGPGGREGMRPGTRNTAAFMPWRFSSGAATLHTEPRPSSNVSSTARSGGALRPRSTATYSSTESVR